MVHLKQTEVARVGQRPCLGLLTVFSRETSNNRRFWAQPEVIYSLDFELIRSEGICIIDVVL